MLGFRGLDISYGLGGTLDGLNGDGTMFFAFSSFRHFRFTSTISEMASFSKILEKSFPKYPCDPPFVTSCFPFDLP